MSSLAGSAVEGRRAIAGLTPVVARGAEVLDEEVLLRTGQTLVFERTRTSLAAVMAISTFVQSIMCIVLPGKTVSLAEPIRSKLEVSIDAGQALL